MISGLIETFGGRQNLPGARTEISAMHPGHPSPDPSLQPDRGCQSLSSLSLPPQNGSIVSWLVSRPATDEFKRSKFLGPQ